MGWTILNLVCFAIGAYCAKIIWKAFIHGELYIIISSLLTIFLGIETGIPYGIIFLILVNVAGVLAGMTLKGSNGISGSDLQKAFNDQQAAKARANPTLAMLDSINLNLLNNSTTSTSFLAQQQKESDEWTQNRINTIGDINAGRAPNGTNGVWLKD